VPGAVFTGPSVSVTEDHVEIVRNVGGYTHSLFTDPAFVRRRGIFPAQPVPAEWTLFLLGGLAEQTGVFDDTVIALVGIDEVRFPAPAMVGDSVSLEMVVVSRTEVKEGRRGLVELGWRAVNQRGLAVLTCRVSMLFRLDGG
jgi:acyl dehydratase